jgi:hypothetical protein
MEAWRAGYLRAVLDFVGAPEDVDLDTVKISGSWEEAGGYSEYTNWDAEITMEVAWLAPEDDDTGLHAWHKVRKGDVQSRQLRNEEVAKLINSF